MKRRVLTISLFFAIFISGHYLRADDQFQMVRGNHFIVYFESDEDKQWANQVKDRADRYYDKIASDMGYARYQNYWSWDNRAKIIIYSSKEKFHQETGQPSWANAGAVRDQYLFKARIIVTYKQHADFLINVLPHEISHLMLQDFIGAGENLPIWFDEAIAQMQESDRLELSRKFIKFYLKEGRYIPFKDIFIMDIRMVNDQGLVQLFYTQSVTMVDFLIKKYGNSNFQELCFQMKNGLDFMSAFNKVYSSSMDSVGDFEKKWLRYMQNE